MNEKCDAVSKNGSDFLDDIVNVDDTNWVERNQSQI
jgi:hypothetical protein